MTVSADINTLKDSLSAIILTKAGEIQTTIITMKNLLRGGMGLTPEQIETQFKSLAAQLHTLLLEYKTQLENAKNVMAQAKIDAGAIQADLVNLTTTSKSSLLRYRSFMNAYADDMDVAMNAVRDIIASNLDSNFKANRF